MPHFSSFLKARGHQLRHLEVNNIYMDDDSRHLPNDALNSSIVEHCKNLRGLNLEHCGTFTSQVVDTLLRECRELYWVTFLPPNSEWTPQRLAKFDLAHTYHTGEGPSDFPWSIRAAIEAGYVK